jgi:serpin B
MKTFISICLVFLIISLIISCDRQKASPIPTPVPTKINHSEICTPVNNNSHSKPDRTIIKADTNNSYHTKFAFKIFSELIKENKKANIFISPLSIDLALTMACNGAEGKTKKDMAEVLEINDLNLKEINENNRKFIESLLKIDPKIELSIANSLWCRNDFNIKTKFINKNRDCYKAEVKNRLEATLINEWVKEKTGGKIDRIVDTITPDIVLCLINAIYFKGKWSKEFDKKLTEEKYFYLLDGSRKKHLMMSQFGSYKYYKNDKIQAIELPYEKDLVSMFIFLPKKNYKIEDFLSTISTESWNTWMNNLSCQTGTIVLPVFKLEYSTDLNKILTDLGMGIAFNKDMADFSDIIDDMKTKPYISKVKHKSLIEVNEEGTVAAAATVIYSSGQGLVLTEPPKPFSMIVDHPFFFVIRDNHTGNILFMGLVIEPK